ncbi:phage minor tail protein [Caballeronia pedi]|uniref:Phage minor tail protein n=1 Tax=Caballeronia pedi TaxID=1777141 RepID=A0A158BI57_9BURK|nr:phage tail protein [Caballeronia pedi]SAK69456.1 phage minor tail protein [Caballeronia pedi]
MTPSLPRRTFTWSPLVGAEGTTHYRVRTVQFGDGYSQAVPDGIRNIADAWPLRFVADGSEIKAIRAFLDSTRGSEPFYWTPPLRTRALFRVDAQQGVQTRALGGGLYSLGVTFKEVFDS